MEKLVEIFDTYPFKSNHLESVIVSYELLPLYITLSKERIKEVDEKKLRLVLTEMGFLNIDKIFYDFKRRDGVKLFYPSKILIKIQTEDVTDPTPVTEQQIKSEAFFKKMQYYQQIMERMFK